MRTFHSTIILFCMVWMAAFSSCERISPVVTDHAATLQFDEDPCAKMDPMDLDLSGGFKGHLQRNTQSTGPDFFIRETDASFRFPEQPAEDPCTGFCAFEITFETLADVELDIQTVEIEAISLTYWDGGVVTEDVLNYVWNPPVLSVGEVVSGTVVDYAITFANSAGSGLQVADIAVSGGLCVVDNVSVIDPLTIINIDLPDKPN